MCLFCTRKGVFQRAFYLASGLMSELGKASPGSRIGQNVPWRAYSLALKAGSIAFEQRSQA